MGFFRFNSLEDVVFDSKVWNQAYAAPTRKYSELTPNAQCQFIMEIGYAGYDTIDNIISEWGVDTNSLPKNALNRYDIPQIIKNIKTKKSTSARFPKQNKSFWQLKPDAQAEIVEEVAYIIKNNCRGHEYRDPHSKLNFLRLNYLILKHGLGNCGESLNSGLDPFRQNASYYLNQAYNTYRLSVSNPSRSVSAVTIASAKEVAKHFIGKPALNELFKLRIKGIDKIPEEVSMQAAIELNFKYNGIPLWNCTHTSGLVSLLDAIIVPVAGIVVGLITVNPVAGAAVAIGLEAVRVAAEGGNVGEYLKGNAGSIASIAGQSIGANIQLDPSVTSAINKVITTTQQYGDEAKKVLTSITGAVSASGSLDLQAAVSLLQGQFPKVSPETIRNLITKNISLGFSEDSVNNLANELTVIQNKQTMSNSVDPAMTPAVKFDAKVWNDAWTTAERLGNMNSMIDSLKGKVAYAVLNMFKNSLDKNNKLVLSKLIDKLHSSSSFSHIGKTNLKKLVNKYFSNVELKASSIESFYKELKALSAKAEVAKPSKIVAPVGKKVAVGAAIAGGLYLMKILL